MKREAFKVLEKWSWTGGNKCAIDAKGGQNLFCCTKHYHTVCEFMDCAIYCIKHGIYTNWFFASCAPCPSTIALPCRSLRHHCHHRLHTRATSWVYPQHQFLLLWAVVHIIFRVDLIHCWNCWNPNNYYSPCKSNVLLFLQPGMCAAIYQKHGEASRPRHVQCEKRKSRVGKLSSFLAVFTRNAWTSWACSWRWKVLKTKPSAYNSSTKRQEVNWWLLQTCLSVPYTCLPPPLGYVAANVSFALGEQIYNTRVCHKHVLLR